MKKILIIDDLKSDLVLIKKIIKTHFKDFTVFTATDGVEGLQIAKSHLPDTIILDIFMPGMNGYEVAERLKKDASTKFIPIIMLTANYDTESSMTRALESGANVFLYKPINRVELIAQLKATLRLKAAEDRLIENNSKLKQSEESFKALIWDLPVAFALHSEGKAILANKKALELIGATSEKEILGKSVIDFLHPGVLHEELEKLQKLYAPDMNFMTAKTTFVKLNGEPVTVNLIAKKVSYRGKTAIQLIVEDIEEKVKREKEREQLISQLEISEVLSNSGSWRYDIHKNKAYFSKNLLNICDLTEEEFDNSPQQALEPVYPEDQKKLFEAGERIIREKDPNKKEIVEYRLLTKKGNLKYVRGSATALFNNEGKATEIFGIVKDITDEKHTLQKLKESEERFGIAFDLSPYPIAITENSTTKLIAVNNAFIKHSGYSVDEIIGKSALDLSLYKNPQDRDKLIQLLKENKGKVSGFETQLKAKNGKIVECLIAAQTFQFEGKECILSIVQDISSIKETQREIERRRKKLNQYISTAQVILLVLNKKGNIELINKKGCQLLGLPQEELIGKNWFDHFLPPEEVAETKKVFMGILNGKTELFRDHENYIINNKGEKKLIAWHNTLITDDNGNITGILSSGEDITEKREQEIELKAAKEKALESDRLKSAFLANMSHEIRTPMNAIIGFAQLLKDPDFSPEEKDNFVDIIAKSGKNLLDLINQIIDISKIEAGKVTLARDKTNLNKINNEIAEMFQVMAADKGIEIKINNGLTDKEAVVITDKLKLKQILTNLVNNALKYTAKGTVTLKYTVENNTVKYSVEDTGTGIPEESLPYIFERFRKVIKKGHPVKSGAGLGLSIVKSYVELMGGEIFVESKVGKGSKFLFTLPYKTE